MDGDFGAEDLKVLGLQGQGIVPAGIGLGTTAALTAVTRLAAPVGSGLHRHAPAAAALVSAVFTGVLTKSATGVLVALGTGAVIWTGERLLEFQAQRLLPPAP